MVPDATCDIGFSSIIPGELLVEVLDAIINSISEKVKHPNVNMLYKYKNHHIYYNLWIFSKWALKNWRPIILNQNQSGHFCHIIEDMK